MNDNETHEYENGVRIYKSHLPSKVFEQYKQRNVYEPAEEDLFLEVLSKIPADGVYVNIGAAFGYYPLLAKHKQPNLTIHALEPLDRHYDALVANIALNGFGQDAFTLYRAGIASEAGYAKFYEAGFNSHMIFKQDRKTRPSLKVQVAAFLGKLGVKRFQNPHIVQVPTITMDSLVEAANRPIDLVQMDIQGMETGILDANRPILEKGSIRNVFVATHSKEKHQQCIEILQDTGFNVVYQEDKLEGQPDGMIWARFGGEAE